MKQGLRTPDRNARIYRKPKSWLIDVFLALIVLALWGGVFLGSMVGGHALGMPTWGVLIFAGFCTLVAAALSLLLPPLRRGASALLGNAHGVNINIDPPSC